MNDRVVSEFIDAWNAGCRPSVRAYLARVPDGPERDAHADQLDTWLQVAPTPPDDRAAIRADVARHLDVAALRERAGLSVAELAARVGVADVERVAAYLERLERGWLDPARVSRRLREALGAVLGVEDLSLLFRGSDDVRDELERLSRAALTPAPHDELDRLFTGGP